MDLNHEFNFNNPVEVTKIFRYRKNENEALQEYSCKASFCWEDVMYIEEYPYKDDWEKHRGSKYYVTLRSYSESLLVLGDYESMIQYWSDFRNKYPLYDGVDNRED